MNWNGGCIELHLFTIPDDQGISVMDVFLAGVQFHLNNNLY